MYSATYRIEAFSGKSLPTKVVFAVSLTPAAYFHPGFSIRFKHPHDILPNRNSSTYMACMWDNLEGPRGNTNQ